MNRTERNASARVDWRAGLRLTMPMRFGSKIQMNA